MNVRLVACARAAMLLIAWTSALAQQEAPKAPDGATGRADPAARPVTTKPANPAGAPQPGDELLGLWLDSTKTAVIKVERCKVSAYSAAANGACAKVVWDKEVDNPQRTAPLDCNRQVAQFRRYDNGVWTDGFVYDTRTRSVFMAKAGLKDGQVHVRSYLGNETQGQTEVFTPVDKIPPGCEGKAPESTQVRSAADGGASPKPTPTK